MPIEFRPADPFAPQISEGAGAAQVMQQNNPTLANLYERAAAMGLQAAQGNADRAQQAAIATMGNETQMAMNQQNNRQRQWEMLTGRQVSPRDEFAAQQQMEETQLRYRMHAEMQATELSTAEEMRLQRLQNAKVAVYNNPDLNDTEKANLITQLVTGINPLQERQIRSRMAHEEETTKHLMNLSAMESARMKRDTEFRNTGELDLLTVRDRETGQVLGKAYMDPQGKMVPMGDLFGKGKGTGKGDGENVGMYGMTGEQWLKHYHELEKHVDTNIQKNMALLPNERDPNLTWEKKSELFADLLRGRGMAPTLALHMAGGRSAQGQQQQPQGEGPGSGQIPQADPKAVIDQSIEAASARQDMLPQDRAKLVSAFTKLRSIISEYGSIGNAPEKVQAEAQAARKVIESAPEPREVGPLHRSFAAPAFVPSRLEPPTNRPPNWIERNVSPLIPNIPGI